MGRQTTKMKTDSIKVAPSKLSSEAGVRPRRTCKSVYKKTSTKYSSEEVERKPKKTRNNLISGSKHKKNDTSLGNNTELFRIPTSTGNESFPEDEHLEKVKRKRILESTVSNPSPDLDSFPVSKSADSTEIIGDGGEVLQETTEDIQTLLELRRGTGDGHLANLQQNKKDAQLKLCPYCQFQYRCPKQLAPHIQTAHPTQMELVEGRAKYKCLYCQDSNTRPRNIVKHMHLAHSSHFTQEALGRTKKVKCTEEGCMHIFHREALLRKHLVLVHGHLPSSSPRRSDPLRYSAEKLRERAEKVEKGEQVAWGRRSDGMKHKASTISTDRHKSSRLKDCYERCWQRAREGGRFLCHYCDKTFTHHSLCICHELGHEVKSSGRTDAVGCHECDDRFATLSQLNQHKQTAHRDTGTAKGNVCPVCDKSFASAHYVKIHVNSVHEKKANFMCNECGKTYRHKAGLITHKENHHNPEGLPKSKPAKYECKVCGARLRTYVGMKTHMNKHNGIKPYKCRHCQRYFTSMNHWKSHERIHTGDKAHRCPICYNTFTNPGTLYNHLYRYGVHGTLPKVRNYARGSNVEVLIKAAELCQDAATKKFKSTRSKSARKLEKLSLDPLAVTNDAPAKLTVQNVTENEFELGEHAQDTSVNLGLDTVHFIAQETFPEQQVMPEPDTRVLPDSEAGPSLCDQLTIIQNNGNLEGQEIKIVTINESVFGSNSSITLPSGQQIALIIVPEDKETINESTSQNELLNVINMDVDQEENTVQYILPQENTVQYILPNESSQAGENVQQIN